MAKFKDPSIPAAAFTPYLEPGEQVKCVAYGIKQPSMFIILPLVIIALLPGLIAMMLLTKEYVAALTNRRVIVLRFKSKKINVQEVLEYPLSSLPTSAKTSTGPLFTHIAIRDAARPFVAKFHRLGLKNNRDSAMAIGSALTGQAALPAH